jgi:hypothetical protein
MLWSRCGRHTDWRRNSRYDCALHRALRVCRKMLYRFMQFLCSMEEHSHHTHTHATACRAAARRCSMCITMKCPEAIRLAKEGLAKGMCVVIGLQVGVIFKRTQVSILNTTLVSNAETC